MDARRQCRSCDSRGLPGCMDRPVVAHLSRRAAGPGATVPGFVRCTAGRSTIRVRCGESGRTDSERSLRIGIVREGDLPVEGGGQAVIVEKGGSLKLFLRRRSEISVPRVQRAPTVVRTVASLRSRAETGAFERGYHFRVEK